MPERAQPERAQPGPRAERTRAAILEAAEAIFADHGFAATRLDDVALRVGIRRASIVYYYRDKRELYEAMLESVFEDLYQRLASALTGDAPVAQRIEAGVGAWVDAVGARPTLARLILREVADSGQEGRPGTGRHTRRFFELIEREILASPDIDDAQLLSPEPVHVASTIAGATVFFVAAIPTLVPELGIDPVAPDRLAAHKDEMLVILRRLLGTRGPKALRPSAQSS